jgi:hypothetical protein
MSKECVTLSLIDSQSPNPSQLKLPSFLGYNRNRTLLQYWISCLPLTEADTMIMKAGERIECTEVRYRQFYPPLFFIRDSFIQYLSLSSFFMSLKVKWLIVTAKQDTESIECSLIFHALNSLHSCARSWELNLKLFLPLFWKLTSKVADWFSAFVMQMNQTMIQTSLPLFRRNSLNSTK